jgi:hypothetical protein
MKIYKLFVPFLAVAILFSCQNADVDYSDFGYTTVYFANQYPMRTLELGDDPQVDNSLDNERKIKIMATMGGVYANTVDRIIDIEVDESLCDGVTFDNGAALLPLPANYYTLQSNQIVIKAGSILGGVVVQLTDAFFEDPLTINRRYVIPLLMYGVTNADSILSGKATVNNPNRLVSDNWVSLPKDYVLYGVKYVNKYHAKYLRRGFDQITNGTLTTTDVRRKQYVEYDEEVSVSTSSLKVCTLPIKIYKEDNLTTLANIELILTFDDNNNCTVSANSASYTVSGTGKFVTDGEKKSMGGTDRDALYLDYTVDLTTLGYKYATKDTLVCKNRGVVPEYYKVKVQ